MITTVKVNNVGGAMFEAMKHGVEAEHLGNGMVQFSTNYLEKISLIVDKLNATIISEEEVVPLTPYGQDVNGQNAYDIYRRMA